MSPVGKCPLCSKEIPFEEKEGDPTKQVAFCSCRGTRVPVIEKDALPRGLKVRLPKTTKKEATNG